MDDFKKGLEFLNKLRKFYFTNNVGNLSDVSNTAGTSFC